MEQLISYALNSNTYTSKPNADEARKLVNFKGMMTTTRELCEHIGAGRTITPAILKNEYRNEDNFQNVSLMFFDLDGIDKTAEDFISRVYDEFKAKPLFWYESFSHQEERKSFKNCYRVVYAMTRVIDDLDEFKTFYTIVFNKLGGKEIFGLDPALKNPCQMLYGTNKQVYDTSCDAIPLHVPAKENLIAEEIEEIEREHNHIYNSDDVTTDQLRILLSYIGDDMLHDDYQTWYPKVFAVARYSADKATFLELIAPYLDNQRNTMRTVAKIFDDSKRDRTNKTTLGTLIYHAQQKGFDGFPVSFNNLIPSGEKLNNDQYIQKDNVLDLIRYNQKSLLIANAGSGKTTATIEAVYELIQKNDFNRAVFLFPTTILTKQAYQDASKAIGSSLLLAYQRGNGDVYQWNKGQKRVLFCTYDMYNKLKLVNDDLVIIDEIHLLNDYSNFKRTITKKLKALIASDKGTVLGLTATPQATPLSAFDNIAKYEKSSNKKTYVVSAGEKRKSQLKAIEKLVLRKKGKKLIYINSKVKAEKLKEDLADIFPSFKINTVHAENKQDNADFDAIVDQATLVSDIVIATKLINVGVNIKNTVSDIIAINLYDFTEIMQLINRERSACDFTLFYTPKTRKASNKSVQAIINKDEKTSEAVQDLLNAYHESFSATDSVIADSLTNNTVTSELETFFGTVAEGGEDVKTLIARIRFDRWQDRYNELLKLYKMIDPKDVLNFLIANNVDAYHVDGFDYDDVTDDDQEDTPAQSAFNFKNVKDVFEQYETEDLRAIREDVYAWNECQQYIVNNVEKNKIVFLRDYIFDNVENYDFIREQGITTETKYKNFMHAKQVIDRNDENHKIFAPLVRALQSNDKALILSKDEIYNICYLSNSEEISEKRAVSILKKYRKITSKRNKSRKNGDRDKIFYNVV